MFGLKPPLYYLPGKAPSDAAASPLHSLSPHPGVSPWGPPQPGDSPLSSPASGSQGRFGGELTFYQQLIKGFGVWEGERGGSREPWHGTAVFWGARIPLSSLAATPSPWGFLPLPEEPGALWLGWDGEKCGVRCVLGCQPRHCEGTAIWGTKVCCATPAGSFGSRGSRRGRGIPPGGFGGHWWGWGVRAGCVLGERFEGALGCSRVGAGGALGVQAQGACLGCSPGV